jgi:hypothetical protein
MKFDSVGQVEEIVWTMRLVDLPRGTNRAILDKLYNGDPPETREEAEENQNQVNRNFLDGPNKLIQARSQWNNAMMGQAQYYGVTLDSGPVFKRQEWSHSITTNISRQLKRCRPMMEQTRAEGAQVLLHGIAPSGFKDRRYPIPKNIPISSLLIPSDTEIDFENLEYYSVFRELTPSRLWDLTHGPTVDPGWNMDAVDAAWQYTRDLVMKDTNASALQYMPERWEDLRKQDMGYLGTDAVPTIDFWDFYFREKSDGDGWYRRAFLDWGVPSANLTENSPKPESRNGQGDQKKYGGFLYTSGKRKFASYVSEILQCQFGDCSAVAPFKYHTVRSLGWLLWGVCDIQNRMRCRFTENIFMQFLWWFRVAGQNDFQRIKKAMFENMGVIPAGISMIPAQERFKPDNEMVREGFQMNMQTMGEMAATFTNNSEDLGKEETATGTMARVHSVNALMSGILTLAYEYSKYKFAEISRRFCIKRSPYKMVRDFQLACIKDGVPEEMLDSTMWNIEPDKAIGGGNKILEMAIIQFLQGIRQNLGPDAQRKVDHMSIVSATDQPALAEDLAPIKGQQKLSPSSINASDSTTRILRGLDFFPSPEMVPEDYVTVWLHDMGTIIQQIQATGGVGDQEKLAGLAKLVGEIEKFLAQMSTNENDMEKVKQYQQILSDMVNHLKGFAQRLQEQQGQQQNGNGVKAEDIVKAQLTQQMGQLKLQNTAESHAARTAQKQASFELTEQRADRKNQADIRRENERTQQELAAEALRTGQEVHHENIRTAAEIARMEAEAKAAPKPTEGK